MTSEGRQHVPGVRRGARAHAGDRRRFAWSQARTSPLSVREGDEEAVTSLCGNGQCAGRFG